jgi:hypothetical protein
MFELGPSSNAPSVESKNAKSSDRRVPQIQGGFELTSYGRF